jgi:hypothetical protein
LSCFIQAQIQVYHVTPITETNKVIKKCVAIKIAGSSNKLGKKKQWHGIKELQREAITLNDLSIPRNKHIIKLNDM